MSDLVERLKARNGMALLDGERAIVDQYVSDGLSPLRVL